METKHSYRRFIILTVEPIRNKNFRLGLMKSDFEKLQYIHPTANIVELKLGFNQTIFIEAEAITVYRNQGRIVNPLISNWIILSGLNETERGKPAKIIFEFKISGQKHIYTLYKNQLNLICKTK